MINFKRGLNPMIFIGQLSPGDRGWCAYLLPQGVTYTKDTLELDQVFYERYGSFLFSPKEVSLDSKEKADEFVSSIKSYIASRHASYRHLLWADDFSNLDGICGISFFNNKMTSATNWVISSSLTLHWEEGCSLSYDAAKKCLSIKGRDGLKSSMYIAKNYPDGEDGKHYPIREIRGFLNGGVNVCLELGCLEFDLVLSLNGDFDELDFGLRYFAYDKINKRVCSQRYPILSHASTNVGLKVRLDPTCYLNHDRNFWAFDQASSPLPSSFITTVGHRIMITPVVNDYPSPSAPAGMVFAKKSITPSDDFYLAPQGDFTLGVQESPSNATTFSLLCGLSATESIIFTPKSASNSGDRLKFKPDMPALSSQFPADGAALDELGSSGDGQLNTSWVTLVSQDGRTIGKKPQTPWYDAQPEGAPLFAKEGSDILKFHQEGIGLAIGEDLYLPLATYASLNVDPKNGPFDAKGIANFELKVIGPARRNLIEGRRAIKGNEGQRALEEASNKYVTPQGFIVTVDDNGAYKEALLARTGKTSESIDLKFTNPTMELQGALQTNQLFLVATNSGCLGSFSNLISIEGWNFGIDLPSSVEGEDYRNVMILKFCKGTLRDLVEKPSIWTQVGDFNNLSQITALSLWLQDYIDEALDKAQDSSSKEGALYSKFASIAVNENWNGIMLLKVDIKSLPSNLSGLIAGVNKSNFFAHHLGIEANHIDSDTVDIKDKSSVFGAIYYYDTSDLPAIDGNFYFRVKDLSGLFENSALKSFESKVELVMNRILDHPVLHTSIGSTVQNFNGIVLKGSCQKKEDGLSSGSANSDGIVFVMDSDESCSFYLDSNILRKVEVVKAQMSMIEASGKNGRSTNRFDLWGFMDFAALKYKVRTAESTPANARISSAIIVPSETAFRSDRHEDTNLAPGISMTGTVKDSFTGCGPGEDTRDSAARILKDMGISNEISEAPECFIYPMSEDRARGPVEISWMRGADGLQTKLFDIFSYGNEYNPDGSQQDVSRKGLYFSGLCLLMSFPEGGDVEKEFSFDLSRIAIDLEKSTVRKGSLANQFAMKAEAIEAGRSDLKPDSGGFLKVETKTRGPSLSSPEGSWYGLRYSLNMGTLGDLAGKAGLTSGIRVAWGTGEGAVSESYSAFVGIKLPGTEGVKVFDLQGFMKLSIGAIRLGAVGSGYFVLILSSIALKLMGLLKIPPSGGTSFYLFGSSMAGEKGLGWYAMYKKS